MPTDLNPGFRMLLGKRLKLDVGAPNELMRNEDGTVLTMPNGDTVEKRDALGLAVDPALYAKKTCNQCYGRGIVILHQPISKEQAVRMRADSTAAALLHENRNSKKSRAAVRETERCMCAAIGYGKAVEAFTKALIKEGLAKRVGWVRENMHSWPREHIELV